MNPQRAERATDKLNVARLIYIGKAMGYPEKEIWKMTIRKLLLLYIEHLKENGRYAESSIDDVIPF